MIPWKPEQIADPIETFDYCDAEIVIGSVCAVGTDSIAPLIGDQYNY
jgi:hypothetical protein